MSVKILDVAAEIKLLEAGNDWEFVERIFSYTFDIVFSKEIGRYEEGFVESFCGVGIIVTRAVFQLVE